MKRFASSSRLVIALALAFAVLGCGRSGTSDEPTTVSGTVTYRERMALPPDAVVEVAVEDVSLADAPAEVLGSIRVHKATQSPIPFAIPYDPRRIDARKRYAARARITQGSEVLFVSDEAYPVLTQGRGNRVEIVVRKVSAAESGAGAPVARTPGRGAPVAAPIAALPASFVGDLPCADCRGIRYQLNLFPDRAFYLRMASLGRGREATFDDIGTWSVSDDGTTLVLHGGREAPMQFAIVDARTLRKLDPEGRPIQSTLPHEIVRSEGLQVFEPRLTLTGMYDTNAGHAAFQECLTGQRWPVAAEGAGATLAAAHAEARQQPNDAVLAVVEGRIVQRPKQGGGGNETALVVERVVGVRVGESCAPAESSPPLEGTDWALAQLGDKKVEVEPERQPHLSLQSDTGKVVGSGGCNRMFGSYSLNGNGLRFSGLGGTKMACTDMSLETAFMQTLERVDTWRIVDNDLHLYDAQEVVLMRLSARATP